MAILLVIPDTQDNLYLVNLNKHHNIDVGITSIHFEVH